MALNGIAPGEPTPNQDAIELLAYQGLTGERHWPWVGVDRTHRQQGWKLHVTCLPPQLPVLIGHLAAVYRRHRVPFKVIESSQSLVAMNEGAYGISQIGKSATIYPESDAQFLAIGRELSGIEDLDGPMVPDDLHLGGPAFGRYGSFNPILKRDLLGQTGQFIEDLDGTLVPDGYDRDRVQERYKTAFGGQDPFNLLVDRPRDEGESLLQGRYLVVDTLSTTAKGRLLQAFDLHARPAVRPVIVKEGRAHVLSDEAGFDIRDRLRHQETMHALASHYGISPVCDPYFEIDGDGYLPIEYQLGRNFEEYVQDALASSTWDAAPVHRRATLLAMLRDIARHLQRLHTLGIVHRDLSPSNILLDENGRITISDLEIAWKHDGRVPVFGKGTPGFMAPEQARGAEPRPSADVFSFAALCLYGLTGLDPRRLPLPGQSDGWRSLRGLCRGLSSRLWGLCLNGLSPKPSERPSLDAFIRTLESEIDRTTDAADSDTGKTLQTDPTGLLHAGTATLSSPALRDAESGLWLSPPIKSGGDRQSSPELRRGFNRGVAGILYYCACYARHYPVDADLRQASEVNAAWLIGDRQAADYGMPGLHFGEAGVLVALYAARDAGLVLFDDADIDHLWDIVLDTPLEWPDFTHGAAGILIALHRLMDHTRGPLRERVDRRIADAVRYLLDAQNDDGSWTLPDGVDGISGETLSGFAHGSAGIAYALARIGADRDIQAAIDAARRTAGWLSSVAVEGTDTQARSWYYSDKNRATWHWWCHGGPGISYLYAELYRVTGDLDYKADGLRCFGGLPDSFNPANLSLCHGAAGLTEILLDTRSALGELPAPVETLAQQLVRAIAARHFRGTRDLYWVVEDTDFIGADLLIGMTGVLHLLLRLDTQDATLRFPGLD